MFTALPFINEVHIKLLVNKTRYLPIAFAMLAFRGCLA